MAQASIHHHESYLILAAPRVRVRVRVRVLAAPRFKVRVRILAAAQAVEPLVVNSQPWSSLNDPPHTIHHYPQTRILFLIRTETFFLLDQPRNIANRNLNSDPDPNTFKSILNPGSSSNPAHQRLEPTPNFSRRCG